ncbi:hypothetical protein V1264_008834 [Littorina saxatilis]|uniref:Uncharacterized protein n=1 Tax=Littorina saxatilis TaxID=31220 RepID=A0AAN9AQK1_9CAEN
MSCHSPTSLTFVVVAIFLGLLVSMPTGSEGRTCVFRCMREVFTCKRKVALVEGGADACCNKYFDCFLQCKPGATDLPPCVAGAGKRGSWNKRDFDREGQLTLKDFF